jgi:hypothetical protein
MRNRTPISVFPFLSVLLSTLGVLSFLAVTFLLFSRAESAPEPRAEPVRVQWVGAPAHVRPILVECRADALVLHGYPGAPGSMGGAGSGARRFERAALEREAALVRQIVDAGYERMGAVPGRTQLWIFVKQAIQGDARLAGSFTRLMHDVELDNLGGGARSQAEEHYPILLVYPDGVATYDLASYLVETTTRLSIGLEPMLKGWALPYQEGRGA